MQCFQNATFQAPHFGPLPGLRWKSGIQELLKVYHATSLKPGQKSLDFQLPRKPPKWLAAHRVLLHGPFAVRDLVLMKQPQTPKGQRAGPFRVIEIVSRYTYRLSDGQKWNCCHLKRYLPSPVEWTELAPQLLIQPQGENALPGPVAIAP